MRPNIDYLIFPSADFSRVCNPIIPRVVPGACYSKNSERTIIIKIRREFTWGGGGGGEEVFKNPRGKKGRQVFFLVF